jgi:hypothetical protein
MTLDRPWLALLTVLPLLWILFEWRRGAHRIGSLLKGLAIAAVLLALAEPRLEFPRPKWPPCCWWTHRPAYPPLTWSVRPSSPGRVERARGRNWTRVIPFARAVRQQLPARPASSGR